MKKLGLAVAVATALGATSAVVHAYSIGTYANGLLVPYASPGEGTAVGLMTCAGGNVAWTFFDENSKHVTDGVIKMTKNDFYSFILSREAGIGLENQNGYLVFVLDDQGKYNALTEKYDLPDGSLSEYDTPCLAGNAFQIHSAEQDVIFQPTYPLHFWNFGHGDGVENISGMDNDSLTSLSRAPHRGDIVSMRYYIDNKAGGDDTRIFVWTICKPPASNTVLMYDSDENVKSVNILMPNDELNIIDPETILGRPASFLDGYINWKVAAAERPLLIETSSAYCNHGLMGIPVFDQTDSDETAIEGSDLAEIKRLGYHDRQSAMSWSFVSSPLFGAIQTLINPHLDVDKD